MAHVLLTITTTMPDASDLGFLLHKNPSRPQRFDVSVGTAHVFYPEAAEDRCTAALLLEVDPIALVRGASKTAGGDGFTLGQYVNDRPYAASSMLAMALAKVFRTALSGRCDARPELARTAIPLQVAIPALPCRGGGSLAAAMFAPLGWQVEARPVPLDDQMRDWGDSRYLSVLLTGELTLSDALSQLYVMLPVLDDAKHYWVGSDEVDKLIRSGAGWLSGHPARELIARRYLSHRAVLTHDALTRLAELDDAPDPETRADGQPDDEPPDGSGSDGSGPDGSGPDRSGPDAPPAAATAPPRTLSKTRREAVLAAVAACGARRVGDLGCGEGQLAAALLTQRGVDEVVAVDVSTRSLQVASRRLRLDRMSEQQRARVELFQSSLTYRDDRLRGLDAAVLMEVVEHLEPSRLGALERTVFGHAAPATVIVTTPNAEHNVRYPGLAPGAMRHRDHRFEWTRQQFQWWAAQVGERNHYDVRFAAVGEDDPQVGPPTQMAIFARRSG